MTEGHFESWTSITLYVPTQNHPPDWRLDFPMTAYPGDLPGLLTVKWPTTGRKEIAGTGSWGSPGQPPDATAVHIAPHFLRALARVAPLPTARHHEANVRRTRWWEILLYKRGFISRTVLTLAVAAAAVGGAIFAFVVGEDPFGWGLIVLLGFCLAELGKALKDIRDWTRV